jgi:ABC-type glycerol-3-phosphate transport system permease component
VSAVTAAGRARRRPATRRVRPGRMAGQSAFYLLVAAFVVVSLFPFYWIVITSLKSDTQIAAGTTSLLPGRITWSNYADDLTKQDFVRPLVNSVIVAVSATVITIVLASLAGYALSSTRIRGKPLFQGFFLVAGFFPVIAMVGPLFISYRDLGLLDNLAGVVIAYLIYTLPLATWFLASYFGQIPRELEEAAVVDGASRLQALRRVIAPVALPGIFTVAILGFILCWNDFLIAVSFLTSPSNFTAPLAIINLGQSQYQTFYNLIDAAVVMVTLPVAIMMLLAQRRIISGLTAGSLR